MKTRSDLMRAFARAVLTPTQLSILQPDLDTFLARVLAAGDDTSMTDGEFTACLQDLIIAGPDMLQALLRGQPGVM